MGPAGLLLRRRQSVSFIEQLPKRRPQRPAVERGLVGETPLDHLTPVNVNRRLPLEAQLEEVDIVFRTERGAKNMTGGGKALSLDGNPGFLLQLSSRGGSVLLVAPDSAARDSQHLSIGVADHEQSVIYPHQHRSAPHLGVKQPPVDAEAKPGDAERETVKSVQARLSVRERSRCRSLRVMSRSNDGS